MRRFICVLLSCMMVLGLSTVAFAENGTTEVDTYTIDGVTYQNVVQTYNAGTPTEYKTLTITGSDGMVITASTNNDYIVKNGETIHYTVTEMPATRASRPTAIEHGLSIGSNWIYSRNTWLEVTTEEDVRNLGVFAIQAVLFGCGFQGASDVLGLANELYNFYNSTSVRYPDAFWVRTYYYGYSGAISQFAYVKQLYSSDYDKIPDGARKVNPTPYPF